MNDHKIKKILILGGYGNFGKRLSITLVKNNIPIIIAGRNKTSAEQLHNHIKEQHGNAIVDIATFDVDNDLSNQLAQLKPAIVINTCGPFQDKDYHIPLTCIKHNIHYLDLSDARDFVNQITLLDDKAKQAGVAIISGASTVPGLSSAVLDHFKKDFKQIKSLTYGISPGQQADRGLATTESILSYLGKPLKPAPGSKKIRYGWQDIYRQAYPEIGHRWMANCDIPDLDLLSQHYKINEIQFSAGMESKFLHFGIWLTSWAIRLGLPITISKHAKFLLNLSHYFDRFGTPDGGMHMIINGIDYQDQSKTISWFVIAKNGDGPQIPIIPAVILAKKLLCSTPTQLIGAQPCVGLVTLEQYLEELSEFDVTTHIKKSIPSKNSGC